MNSEDMNEMVKKLNHLSGLSKSQLKKTLKGNPQLYGALKQFRIEESIIKSKERDDSQDHSFSNVGRRSIMNEGNTCYLNSALQALRNSLDYTGDLGVGPFGKKLKLFFEGRERSLVATLERELGTNLRKQSDSAEYFNKVCKLLESEGSAQILDKIKLKNNIVTWKCSSCQHPTDDTRGSRVTAYSLALAESGRTKEALSKALHYERDRTCKNCEREVLHHGHKRFDVHHLTIVASDPYLQKLKVDTEFDLGDVHYDLISAVLHSGGTHGGHYISVVKDDSGSWSSCNDSFVQTISPSELNSYFSKWTTTQLIYKVQQKTKVEISPSPTIVGLEVPPDVSPSSESVAPPSTEREEPDEMKEETEEETKDQPTQNDTQAQDGDQEEIKTIEDEEMNVETAENDSYCNV